MINQDRLSDLSQLREKRDNNRSEKLTPNNDASEIVMPEPIVISPQQAAPAGVVVMNEKPVGLAVLEQISDKISALIDIFQTKYVNSPVLELPVPPTVEVAQDNIPSPVIDKPIPESAQVNPNVTNVSGSSDDAKKDEKIEKERKKDSARIFQPVAIIANTLKKMPGTLVNSLKNGFNSVSSLLFGISVSQAIGHAKLAALVFSVIVLADIFKIYITLLWDWLKGVWEKFIASWEQYFANWGKWGKIFETIDNHIGKIWNAFETGDFKQITVAIVDGLASVISTLQETLIHTLGTLFAKLLSALGFEDAAKAIGEYFDHRASDTHGSLTNEEKHNVAKKQSREIAEGKDPFHSFRVNPLTFTPLAPLGLAKTYGDYRENKNITDAEKKSIDKLRGMSSADRERTILDMNEAKRMTLDFRERSEGTRVSDPKDMERLAEHKAKTLRAINNGSLDKVPDVKRALLNEVEQAQNKVNARIPKSTQPVTKRDAEVAQNITNQRVMNNQSTQNVTNNANVTNAKVTNNNSYNIQQPVTRTQPASYLNRSLN